MLATGATREYIMKHWDIPLLNAYRRVTRGLPPLQVMVGAAAGYELSKIEEKRSRDLTPEELEEHAGRLLGQIMGAR